MKTVLILILLQFSLFKSNNIPVTQAKVYLEEANSHEIIAFTRLGKSGNFNFSNLDPGVYVLSIEIPENAVPEIDKRTRSRYDTNILVAYNKSRKVLGWQRKDGFVQLSLINPIKIADLYQPMFESYEPSSGTQEEETQKKTTFFERLKMANRERDYSARIKVMQLTVANQFGSFSGSLQSVSQRDFHKVMVGTKKISLEDQGIVDVLISE